MKKENIDFRVPNSLGCAVASTAIIQALKSSFPEVSITAYTKTPDLFEGLPEISCLVDLEKEGELPSYDIDLSEYVEARKPQELFPHRHLIAHMCEIVEEQLDIKGLSRNFLPKIILNSEEEAWAQNKIKEIANEKPVVWLQTRSSSSAKDIPQSVWTDLLDKHSNTITFFDLHTSGFNRRQSISFTKYANAGIVPDSFLLHGSQAVAAHGTIVLLVSSYRDVVTYLGQHIIDTKEIDSACIFEALSKVLYEEKK